VKLCLYYTLLFTKVVSRLYATISVGDFVLQSLGNCLTIIHSQVFRVFHPVFRILVPTDITIVTECHVDEIT
jgi:hypothetical protein